MIPEYKPMNHKPFDRLNADFTAGLQDFYVRPSAYAFEPFQIFGNLYYVGDQKVCSHLVDTGDGLILFDTGYRHALHLLLESIRKLGFDPAQIKYIIQSHGHFDHFGGSNEMRALYGCKVLMSAVDTALLRENPARALIDLGPVPQDEIAWPDQELQDGDIIELGNTKIRCVLSPGHTPGVMSFFFDVTDGKTTYRAGYLGGAGFLTIYKDLCRQYDLPLDLCQQLAQTVRKLRSEPVDITLGNHPGQNRTLHKRRVMLENPGENPFLKPDWQDFLSALEESCQLFEELGY